MRARILVFAALLAWPGPAWAVREWYESYLDARDKHIPAKRYAECLIALKEAVRQRPEPGLQIQTYGVQFLDYFPYYYMGICFQAMGEPKSAITNFDAEVAGGSIKRRNRLHEDLFQRRNEAQATLDAAERKRVSDQARGDVETYMREAVVLERARRFDEALARLNLADAGARFLDARTQRAIAEAKERVKKGQQDFAAATARANRIEQGLLEGARLLEEGDGNGASSHFDTVLAVDPQNQKAIEGKLRSRALILATTTRLAREKDLQEGRGLLEAGQYPEAIEKLTNAAVDIPEAAALLRRAYGLREGLRKQRETRAEIERLYALGDELMAARQYEDAQVSFDGVLRLDPEHTKARKRREQAVEKTVEGVFARYQRDEPPTLTFIKPDDNTEVDGPTVSVMGAAWDDRGIQKVEFRLGGRVVAEIKPAAGLDNGEAKRQIPFERELPLEPGSNMIAVSVVDMSGLSQQRTFTVTRRLRFYETRAFIPTALGGALGLLGLSFLATRLRRRRAIRRRFNPYIAGAPVLEDDMFFGRQKLMARMLNVLHHNSLMITGERRIGKTTFLYHLKKVLAADEGSEFQFFPVFTDLQGVPEHAFFHAVMSDVVDGLRPSPATLAALRLGREPTGYEGRDFSHDLQRVIEELKTRTAKRVKLALLIDEVDVLNEYSERVNQRLRSIFMKTFSENLVAVMSGVGIRRSWQSEVSPWYNFFDEIEIAALSREEAEALIKTPVSGFFRYENEAVEAILTESGRKPYLIQKFCIHAVNRILEQDRTTITAADVAAVRDEVLFEGRPVETFEGPAGV
ncbi:MAG TPA: Ig-like domain-containing protein, partial [Vicinamibacteria bacterium]